MPKIRVDLKYCKGCRLCVAFCPKGALVMSKKLGPRGLNVAEVADASACSGCLNCAVICPDAAIEIVLDGPARKPARKNA